MNQHLIKRIEAIEQEFTNIENQLSQPTVMQNYQLVNELNKKRSQLLPIIENVRQYRSITSQKNDIQEQLKKESDPDLKQLLTEEQQQLLDNIEKLEHDLLILLLPQDENEGKNIFIEIRAGTGGDEATLFAGDLFRMYTRFLERKSMKFKITSLQSTGIEGIKEAIIFVWDTNAYRYLHSEAGTHRVQRIPDTESGGRIHTSACTVAIIPEATEEDISIDPKDLKIDVYRSSGPGGQSVNTTDSAIRITHLPSNITVTCQDEKSQHKNKARALSILRARLKAKEDEERHQQQAQLKKNQIGSGDRSEKIRTYNFPQSRVTDHRIKHTEYALDSILDGDIQGFIDRLCTHKQEQLLANLLNDD